MMKAFPAWRSKLSLNSQPPIDSVTVGTAEQLVTIKEDFSNLSRQQIKLVCQR
jgi:hypothetical protein